MKLTDLRIGTQLRLGLGLILLLVVALSGLAWLQTHRIWLQTKALSEHPIQVRRSVDTIQIQVLLIHRDMKDMCLTEDAQEREFLLQAMRVSEATVHEQFGILRDRYLGPRDDIDKAERTFEEWKAIRDETVRLLQAGKTAEAISRTRPTGTGGRHAEKILAAIKTISDFASNRQNEFYSNTEALKGTLTRQLALMVTAILLLSMMIAGLLLKGIKGPLVELTAAAEQFRQGKRDVRCSHRSANEFGTLAATFNGMADAIQTEMQINEHAAQLAGVMLREEEVHAFCQELLKALLTHTGSQVGAVYFLNDARTDFAHFESVGLGGGGRTTFSATELEGEFGAALATRQIQRITNIPADTHFTFAAVSGDFRPREILTIPVLSDRSVTAVISLASVRAYPEKAVRLVHEIWGVLTARVNGVLAFRTITDLAKRLEHQNRELEAQKRELSAQATELTGQNTELELQKRQLDEASRLKSAFLSNMSHELRTPLNSVIALSGVLNRRLTHVIPAEERGYLDIIERNGKNLLALINDILDLSRIEAGRDDINVSHFSIRELAGEIVAMLAPQAEEKGLTLANHMGEDLPILASDADKCRHILQNLVGNAVKFTERGRVTLTAETGPDTIRVSVTDTGIGIAAEHLAYIFDEFRQADETTSRKYGGTGLGLAIAKRYALLLGGDITVASTPDQGSTFTLQLPLAANLPSATSAAGSTASFGERITGPIPSGQGRNILLVEDNDPAIIQLTDILQAEGYRVQVAHDGQEALAQVERIIPDAMVLDLMMPEVDGFQVLKALRCQPRTAQLPVLILTAKHVTREELSFLKGNHIHQLIQKGDINRNGLLAAVARMVAPPQTPPSARSHVEKPRRRPTRPGKPMILVVEDNPDNLRTAKALLGDRYRIIEAQNGQAGLYQARTHQPDLILTDIALPVMDGFAALAAIRADAALCHIPVIAVTASAMKGNREDILARGFDGYLSKPVDHDMLMKTLQDFLGEA